MTRPRFLTIHDYRKCHVGHNINVLSNGKAVIWSRSGIAVNDVILYGGLEPNTVAVLHVSKAKWCRDPQDMYSIEFVSLEEIPLELKARIEAHI